MSSVELLALSHKLIFRISLELFKRNPRVWQIVLKKLRKWENGDYPFPWPNLYNIIEKVENKRKVHKKLNSICP